MQLTHLAAWRLGGPGQVLAGAYADFRRRPGRQELLGKVGEVTRDWLAGASVRWMRVLENRPEITRRRDQGTPAGWLAGKRVLVLGCGALGAPVAESCVRAGTAALDVVDNGLVTPGILVRQPYSDADIGQPKATVLAGRLAEAVTLYFVPALGHLRLVDLRDFHLQDLVQEMLRINCPLPDGERPSELMRRLLNARADDERRELAPGETRRKKSTRPLTPARIERVFAVLRVALNDAVPGKIMVNPYDGVKLPKVRTTKPLAWTRQRETAFRAGFDRRMRAASAGRDLTTVEMQQLWAALDLRPCKVMVWLPEHTGRFLDSIGGERLYALFCLTAYCGLRRDEVIGLTWAEVDLDQGIAYVRETGSGDGPKSDAGTRVVPLPVPVVQALRAWRVRQAADNLARGRDWTDTGRVFTREDGTGVPGQWVSVRFETLAYRAGLPPVRFHDLRHGAASLCKAAGLDTKYISALLGHTRTSFTDATYVLVFPDVLKAAAEAAAAIVPRAGQA